MDIAQFRLDFPEFADMSCFPNSMIALWSGIGEQLVDQNKWGDLWLRGVQLFTAHNIVIANNNVKAADRGAQTGTGTAGVISSKSVGDVSISYDNSASTSSMNPEDGHWNTTMYGRQYVQLVRLIGMGCIQL
jgi:hypothetical protein